MTNVLTLSFSKNESGDDFIDGANPEARNHFGNIQGFENLDQSIYALDSVLKLDQNWTIKNFINFNRAKYERFDDDNLTLAATNWNFTGVVPATNAGLNDLGNEESRTRTNLVQTFSEEIRLHYEDSKLKAHAGFYYARIDTDDDRSFVSGVDSIAFNAGLAGLVGLGFPERVGLDAFQKFSTEETNWAVFGDASYDVTDLFTVFGGVRYDTVRKDSEFFKDTNTTNLTGLPAFMNGTVNAINGNQLLAIVEGTTQSDDDAILPTGGIALNFTDDLKISALAKRGYRAGGSALSNLQGQLFTFGPEFTWTYEIALRSNWWDDRASFNANIFYTDWKDQQVALREDFGGFTDLIVTNAASSELYGFEADVKAAVTDALTVFGSVGYVQTKFNDFPTSTVGVNFDGNEFPLAPEWTIAGGAHYQFDNGIFVQSDANYTSAVFTEASNDPSLKLDARTIVNARIGYNADQYSVYVYGTNIFDEFYLTRKTEGQSLGNPTRNVSKAGDGQAFGVRFSAKLQ